jgi:DNA-binding SARP family transcriptional activator
MEFRILGPLEVLDQGQALTLGGSKQRALLALLLTHSNETLSPERLIDELWGERPPATAAKAVQVHISRLRKALAADDIVLTRDRGYELRVAPEQVDAHRFERLVAEGRDGVAAADPEGAIKLLERALALWRGRPYADLAEEPFAQRESARLEDVRVTALEQLFEAKLALGRHAEVVSPLEALIAEHPYRERLHAQLMLALYRSDRQADALQAYQNARRRLVEDLGIEPGAQLRELEQAVLAQDPALAVPVRAPVVAPPEREVPASVAEEAEPRSTPGARRLVSIVFADLVGSTGLAERLDPESMHDLLDRFTDRCSAVIERHGGSVEGFVGDAVVGVFGQTEVHEDDALRAVRAALEMRESGEQLSGELERERGVGIALKLGVESGEVFVSAGARRRSFAAGDAFNVASRLEGEAAEGEILLGENLHELVRGSVIAEPLEPLALKGRDAPVRAWRLVALEVDHPVRVAPPGSRFVNRERELGELTAAFARAQAGAACHAVTVVGPPGIGKSRLTSELLDRLAGASTVAVGRCRSYGDTRGYGPLAEIVRALGGDEPRAWVEGSLDEQPAQLVLSAIGMSDEPAQAEETSWAVRKLFEQVASERPLVAVVDDVQWAEPSLLDLLEYLVVFASGHPILLVCLARPEFVEMRPGWAAPMSTRTLFALDALPEEEARALVESAGAEELGTDTAARIVELAEGNPLFLEQLAAIGAEGGDAPLPSTIQAVLAARIARLEPAERSLLEHASVQGRSFETNALAELLGAPGPGAISTQLVSLVHKQLIRPDRSAPGEDVFRFAHALVREAAYHGLPKQRRAELHEALARRPDAGSDELIGYHLGEAHRNLTDLGLAGPHARELAADAAERLAAAARTALMRGDAPAGARLLERAESLLEPGDAARDELLPALGAALFEAGRIDDAARVLDEAIAGGSNPQLRARAQVEREIVRVDAEPDAGTERALEVAEAVRPLFERTGDDYGSCRAEFLRGEVAWNGGRVAEAEAAWRSAADAAGRAGDQRELFELVGWQAMAAALGPTPVDEAIARCEELRERVRSSPLATASTLNPLALLHAMKGQFETSERLLDEASGMLEEIRGLGAGVSHLEALARFLTGRPELVEERLRADVETLSAMSEGSALATTTALLAQCVYAQGRPEEAAELTFAAEHRASAEDTLTQAVWRAVRANVLAHAGSCAEACVLAREAVVVLEQTDLLSHRGDAMLALAEVLRTCERRDEAKRVTMDAIEQYERKGNTVAAERARSLLSE